MNIPNPKWYQAIQVRRSRRSFNDQSISQEDLSHLLEFTEELNSRVEGFRAILVTENTNEVFRGIVGSYGKVKNAPAYAAFIGDMLDPNVQEKTGYLGECFILEATTSGLSTCWVGGFFNPDTIKSQIEMLPTEKVIAVSPVGYTKKKYTLEEKLLSGVVGSHKRKDLDSLCRGLPKEEWPDWVAPAVEAARLAPSAVNRQPWRFTINVDSLTVSVNGSNISLGLSKRLDCGIAMLHAEVGALHVGVEGKWEYLGEPHVARFTI